MGDASRPEANPTRFDHIRETLQARWPESTHLLGIILFGSRVKFLEQKRNADWDVGAIFSGPEPQIDSPDDWDLFLWSEERWEAGFALQVEIARNGIILYDPRGLAVARFDLIREKILPFWGGYLKRF